LCLFVNDDIFILCTLTARLTGGLCSALLSFGAKRTVDSIQLPLYVSDAFFSTRSSQLSLRKPVWSG
jgi:hypothetical protein